MRLTACLVLALVGGCAVAPRPYCSRLGPDESACFETEAERASDWDKRNPRPPAPDVEPPGYVNPLMAAELARQEEARASRALAEADYERRRAAREAERQAEVERASRAAANAGDPAFAVPALGAMICDRRRFLETLKAETARQSRIEAASGVRDLLARRDIGEELERNRAEIVTLAAALRDRYGVAPGACGAELDGATRDVVAVFERELLR